MIDGQCDARFHLVREAFVENFAVRGETGAAVCVTLEGRTVVDLWGGWADQARTIPWRAGTLVDVFSISKGLTAACVAHLVGRSLLEFDLPMAKVWPEFAASGKDGVTLRQVLSHQAGLPAVRRRLPKGAMLDWTTMTAALAGERPWWEPGRAHGYHVNTFGFLVGEAVRRASGRTVGQLLRDEIAGPLGADVHIGLPRREHHRVAEMDWPDPPLPEEEPAGLEERSLMRYNAYFNPSGLSGAGVVNTPEWRCAEIPSANGHATARGVARIYAALAEGGALDGVRVVDAEALAAATVVQSDGEDLVLDRPSRFGLGFQLTQPERMLGPNQRAFGHFGAGGSLGFCDPDARIGFGYVMNAMGPRWQNPRTAALVEALFAALG